MKSGSRPVHFHPPKQISPHPSIYKSNNRTRICSHTPKLVQTSKAANLAETPLRPSSPACISNKQSSSSRQTIFLKKGGRKWGWHPSPAEFDSPARKPKHRPPPPQAPWEEREKKYAQRGSPRKRKRTSQTKAVGRIREREREESFTGSVVRTVSVTVKESERGSVCGE